MEENRMDLVWLGQPDCSDPAAVGGKAANLSRLAADHRVPPGFVVTAAAHDAAMGASHVRDRTSASEIPLPPTLFR